MNEVNQKEIRDGLRQIFALSPIFACFSFERMAKFVYY